MRLLLESHALIWWLAGSPNLSQPARTAIANPENDVFVSAATAWELATKHCMGRLPALNALMQSFEPILAGQGFQPLPITLRHARPHRAPKPASNHHA
jgi:PIN domain nuclease of toxin-antitoxin system